MKRKSPKSIPTPPAPVAPTLVWDGEAPLLIETVTVRRKVIRDTSRGGHVTLDMAISLPRVRFLEMAEDATSASVREGSIDLPTDHEGEPLPLAA